MWHNNTPTNGWTLIDDIHTPMPTAKQTAHIWDLI